MAESPQLQEKIAKRKTIVYKSRVDSSVVKLTAERIKNKLFVKYGFSKPRPEEIQVVSIDKFYEPYILIGGEYRINYSKRRVFTLEVSDQTEEVTIGGEIFSPEGVDNPPEKPRKVVRLDVEEHYTYKDKGYLLLDKSGCEVPFDQVPSAPSEDHPFQVLKEFREKSGRVKLAAKEEIELIRSKIVKRPSDADRIKNEVFNVSEHAVIYSPVYEILFRNLKSGEEKVVKIDGITAKVIQ